MCWMVRRPKGVEEYVSLPYSPPSSVYSSRFGRTHPCSRIGTADATLHGDCAECTTLQRAPAPPSLLKNFECRPIPPRWGSRWRAFGCTSHAASRLQTYITGVDLLCLPPLICESCFLGRDSCARGRAAYNRRRHCFSPTSTRIELRLTLATINFTGVLEQV